MKIFLAIFLLLLCAVSARATDYTNATASEADFDSNYALMSDGDRMFVPAGSATWSDVDIAKAITVIGAGTNSTIITLGTGNSITKDSGGITRIVGFQFTKTSGGNASQAIFIGGSWLSAQPVIMQSNLFVISSSGLIRVTTPGGVDFFNDAFVGEVDDSMIQFKSTGGGEGSWTTADTLGSRDTTGRTNCYVENCNFYGGGNQGIDCDENSRVVFRYNVCMYFCFNSHGYDTSPDGVRHAEVYKSQFNNDAGTGAIANVNQSIWIRGATWFIYSNSIANIAGGYWGDKPELRINLRGAEDNRPQGACGSVSYPVPHQMGQNHNGSSLFTDPVRWYGNTGTLGISAAWNWGNPCGLTFEDFWQEDRDYVIGTAKSGYAAYTYPHPLAAGGGAADTTDPTVAITTPTSSATYSTPYATLTVSGTASDDTAVTSVTWSNDRGGSGSATGTTSWSKANIPLFSGVNVITITAADAAANDATDVITVTRTLATGTITSAAIDTLRVKP